MSDFCRQFIEMSQRSRGAGRKQEGWVYENVEAFLLEHGRSWPPASYTHPWKRGIVKHCFNNALHLLAGDDDLTYCEGYAMGVIPVLHGWLVTEDGRVVDPTWTGGKKPTPGIEYFGVAFDSEYVLQTAVNTGIGGIFYNDWTYMSDPERVLAKGFYAATQVMER